MAHGPRMLLAATALSLLLAGGAARAYSLSFEPTAQTLGLGGEATVAVRISGAQPDGLGAYAFDVAFDPGILVFDRAVDGLGLGMAFGLGASPGTGTLTMSDFSLETEASLLAMQGNDFVLFSLVFDTLAEGTSALVFEQVALGDAAGNTATAAGLGSGSITVEARAIPEPGAMTLVLGALLAGAMPAWRRRR